MLERDEGLLQTAAASPYALREATSSEDAHEHESEDRRTPIRHTRYGLGRGSVIGLRLAAKPVHVVDIQIAPDRLAIERARPSGIATFQKAWLDAATEAGPLCARMSETVPPPEIIDEGETGRVHGRAR